MKYLYIITCILASQSLIAQSELDRKKEVESLKTRIRLLENKSNINHKDAWDLFYNSYGESEKKGIIERNMYHKETVNLYINNMLSNYADVKVVNDAYFELNSSDNSVDLGINSSLIKLEDTKDFMRLSLYSGIKIEQKKKHDAFNLFKNGEGIGQVSGNFQLNYFVKGFVKKDTELTDQVKDYFETADLSYLSNKEIKDKLIEKEVELLESKHEGMSKHWFSLDLKIPFTEREYEFYNNLVDFEEQTKKSYNWNAQFKYNYFRRGNFLYDHNLLFSLAYGAYRDNSVMNKTLTEQNFIDFKSLTWGISQVEEINRYVGHYDYYINHRLMSELTLLLRLKHFYVGPSFAIEQNYNSLNDVINWKIGLPMALKNSEGKKGINIELQWVELYKEHFVGISIVKPFGRFVESK